MLFSILIPTYNNEKTIAKTIESALNQDYKGDYEIVIVNNASTDATLSVIESYDDAKIKLITNPSTVHMYENHNICIENALGDYVVFCHSDDELMPEALKILAKKITKPQGFTSLSRQAQLHIFTRRQPLFTKIAVSPCL